MVHVGRGEVLTGAIFLFSHSILVVSLLIGILVVSLFIGILVVSLLVGILVVSLLVGLFSILVVSLFLDLSVANYSQFILT